MCYPSLRTFERARSSRTAGSFCPAATMSDTTVHQHIGTAGSSTDMLSAPRIVPSITTTGPRPVVHPTSRLTTLLLCHLTATSNLTKAVMTDQSLPLARHLSSRGAADGSRICVLKRAWAPSSDTSLSARCSCSFCGGAAPLHKELQEATGQRSHSGWIQQPREASHALSVAYGCCDRPWGHLGTAWVAVGRSGHGTLVLRHGTWYSRPRTRAASHHQLAALRGPWL